MVCIDHPRCDEYDDLIAEFDSLGGPLGPDVNTGDAEDVAVADLRAWWSTHGCVRCFIEAQNRRPKWERICKFNGHDSGLDDDTYVMGNPQVVDEIRQAIEKWKKTSYRAPWRFYCEDHVQPLRCGCSLFDQFVGDVGHVGWVYGIPKAWKNNAAGIYQIPGDFMIGEMTISTGSDQPGTPCGDDTPFPGDPAANLKNQGYYKWKPLWSRDGNYEEAYLVSRELRERGYLPNNNCNTAANAVLTAFGADLIPAVGDGYGGMYLPGNYFNSIHAPAVTINAIPEPTPTPAPAPISAKALRAMSVEDDSESIPLPDGPPLIDAVYLGPSGGAVHLTRSCPAVQNMRDEPEEIGIIDTDDMADIEAEFEMGVCNLCLRIIEASEKIITTMQTRDGTLYFCQGRLRHALPGKETDFLYERITNFRRKRMTFTPTVIVEYRVPMLGGKVLARKLNLPFTSEQARDDCLQELASILQR